MPFLAISLPATVAVTIEAKFLPWVYSQANQRLEEGVRAGRQAVEELLRAP